MSKTKKPTALKREGIADKGVYKGTLSVRHELRSLKALSKMASSRYAAIRRAEN
jgi:hypothetical protein